MNTTINLLGLPDIRVKHQNTISYIGEILSINGGWKTVVFAITEYSARKAIKYWCSHNNGKYKTNSHNEPEYRIIYIKS